MVVLDEPALSDGLFKHTRALADTAPVLVFTPTPMPTAWPRRWTPALHLVVNGQAAQPAWPGAVAQARFVTRPWPTR
jgi:hypothetical protein